MASLLEHSSLPDLSLFIAVLNDHTLVYRDMYQWFSAYSTHQSTDQWIPEQIISLILQGVFAKVLVFFSEVETVQVY